MFNIDSFRKQKLPLISSYSVDPVDDHRSTRTKETWRQKHGSGWRFGVLACAASVIVVFLINLSLFLVVESKHGFPRFDKEDGKRALYDGNCDTTKKLSVGVHVLINILSTILLGASNYCMQCMSAPTRKDIDSAHAQGKMVDIGVLSIRNLLRIGGKRRILYTVLTLSSLPLHLFYNSTVFASIAVNRYYIYSVNEAFSDPSSRSFEGFGLGYYFPTFHDPTLESNGHDSHAQKLFDQARNGSLKRLEPRECIDAYAQQFQTKWGHLLLVVPDSTMRERYVYNKSNHIPFGKQPALEFEDYSGISYPGYNSESPFAWICGHEVPDDDIPCEYELDSVRADVTKWKPFGVDVLYCLSEPVEPHCRLMYSVHLIIIVLAMNAFKTVVMLSLAIAVRESPLMTIGDAISSVLQQPDSYTEGMCLVTKQEIIEYNGKNIRWSSNIPAKEYIHIRRRRFAAASCRRWITCIVLLTIVIGVVLALLLYGIREMTGPKNIKTILGLGLGAVNTATFIDWSTMPASGVTGVFGNVILANAPQVIRSFIYFIYNGLSYSQFYF